MRCTLTREEAISLLHEAKFVLCDMGITIEAGQADDIEMKLSYPLYMNGTDALALSYLILPNGKRGHIKLVLFPPRVARALAFIVGVLQAFANGETLKRTVG